jgi:hypothetical protein
MRRELAHTAVVVGAGFSHSAGLPLTSDLSSFFLDLRETRATPHQVQEGITRQLRRFWETVFGYDHGSKVFPSFEDHFTALDLAANAGHNLGFYTPSQLRALRRLSIHRVFDLLDVNYKPSDNVGRFLQSLATAPGTSLISTNWDIVVENHLRAANIRYRYGIPGHWDHGHRPPADAFRLVKLHGSANWHYCDMCRRVSFGSYGKTALHSRTFLESRDFVALAEGALAPEVERLASLGRRCRPPCHNSRLTARVATFSYSKAFDFYLFHAAWEKALHLLRTAPFWTFIGYSLPEADFAFKHLLKTAEVGSATRGPKRVRLVDYDANNTREAYVRYARFFGGRLVEYHPDGFDAWVARGCGQGETTIVP